MGWGIRSRSSPIFGGVDSLRMEKQNQGDKIILEPIRWSTRKSTQSANFKVIPWGVSHLWLQTKMGHQLGVQMKGDDKQHGDKPCCSQFVGVLGYQMDGKEQPGESQTCGFKPRMGRRLGVRRDSRTAQVKQNMLLRRRRWSTSQQQLLRDK